MAIKEYHSYGVGGLYSYEVNQFAACKKKYSGLGFNVQVSSNIFMATNALAALVNLSNIVEILFTDQQLPGCHYYRWNADIC